MSVVGLQSLPLRQKDIKNIYTNFITSQFFNTAILTTMEIRKRSAKFHFAPRLKCPDSEVKFMSASEVIEEIKLGNNFFCEKMGEKWNGKDCKSKFYIDMDLANFETIEDAQAELNRKDKLELLIYEHIQMVFNQYCQFPIHKNQLFFVWRTGGVKKTEKEGYKISCHIILNAFSIKYVQLYPFMSLLKRKFQAQSGDIQIRAIYSDLSAYQNKQIQCAWCRKGLDKTEKNRVLKPSNLDLNVGNFLLFLLNYVDNLPVLDLQPAIEKLRSELPKFDQPVGEGQVAVIDPKKSMIDPEEVKQLISILPSCVAESKELSFKVQCVCKVLGIALGDQYMFLDTFVEFIQQKEFFSAMEIDQVYDYVKEQWFDQIQARDKIGIEWLRLCAEHYAPELYSMCSNSFLFQECDDIEITEHLVFKFYDKLKYCNKKWWCYNSDYQVWNCIETKPVVIDIYIQQVLSQLFKEKAMFIKQVLSDRDNISEDQVSQLKNQLDKLGKCFLNCRNHSKCNTYSLSLQNRLEDNKFEELFDMRRDCINFKNGYVVLGRDKPSFQNRTSSDYFQLDTGYDYEEIQDFSKIKEVLLQLSKCFDTSEKYECLLDIIAYSICGDKYAEIFVSMVGDTGRNGKGLWQTLIKHTFGMYHSSINVGYFVGSQSAQSANDQELSLRHCRWIVITEPKLGAKINDQKVKQISGNDEYQARALFKGTTKFTPQSILAFESNQALDFGKNRSAIDQRIVVIDFPYQFVRDKDIIDPTTQFPRDNTLKQKLKDPEICNQFMQFLIHRYYEKGFNRKAPVDIPECVIETNREQVEEMNEDFLSVLKRVCIPTGDMSDYVWHDDLRNMCNSFFVKQMNPTEFNKQMRAGSQLFHYENQRTNKESSGSSKAHKVRKLKTKERINDRLLDFNDFLDDTYIDKFDEAYPIKLYQLMRDYNNWLSKHPKHKGYFIPSDILKDLLDDFSVCDRYKWIVVKNEKEGVRDMYKLKVVEKHRDSVLKGRSEQEDKV